MATSHWAHWAYTDPRKDVDFSIQLPPSPNESFLDSLADSNDDDLIAHALAVVMFHEELQVFKAREALKDMLDTEIRASVRAMAMGSYGSMLARKAAWSIYNNVMMG